MKSFRVPSAIVGACLLSFTAVAHADTFDFTFGTAGVSNFNGSGVLTGTLIATDEYLITGITGTTNTGNGTNRPIDSLQGVGDFQGNDNLLFDVDGVLTLDFNGLSYTLRNGAQVNLFDGGEILERTSGAFITDEDPVSITVAATPEPGSFVLLGTGLLGAVGVARRRFAV